MLGPNEPREELIDFFRELLGLSCDVSMNQLITSVGPLVGRYHEYKLFFNSLSHPTTANYLTPCCCTNHVYPKDRIQCGLNTLRTFDFCVYAAVGPSEPPTIPPTYVPPKTSPSSVALVEPSEPPTIPPACLPPNTSPSSVASASPVWMVATFQDAWKRVEGKPMGTFAVFPRTETYYSMMFQRGPKRYITYSLKQRDNGYVFGEVTHYESIQHAVDTLMHTGFTGWDGGRIYLRV